MTSRFFQTLLRALPLLLALSAPALAGSTPLKVFVSIEPLRYLAERVGGAHVDVETMIAPGENPATFSPSPRKMSRLQRARLFVYVAVPSERSWLPRVRESYPDIRFVDAREGIRLRRRGAAHHGDEHGHDELDPHVWTSPIAAIRVAANIRNALIELDPAHRADYEAGYDRLASELKALDQRIDALLKDLPSRRFMVFHPSWGYFADRYGLTQLAIEREGKSPGIRQLGSLIRQARQAGIDTIFVQPQFSRRDAETIARETGARVVAIDPLAHDIPASLLQLARTLARSARP